MTLIRAIREGDLGALPALLANPVQLDLCRLWGSPLQLAAAEGSTEVLQWLLRNGWCEGLAPSDSDARTALCSAAAAGRLDNFRLLFERAPDAEAGHPLLSAVVGGHPEICRSLLQAGADPERASGDPPRSARQLAASMGRLALLEPPPSH
jgi:ankyrin repeat protein